MADVAYRTETKHKRRQESLSKCKSLPSLQLAADASSDFTCPKCGLTNPLMAICLSCYQTGSDDEDRSVQRKERASWSLLATINQDSAPRELPIPDEQPLFPKSITSQQTSAPSCPVQLKGQFNKVKGSKAETSGIEGFVIASSRLSCNFDNFELRDDHREIGEASAPSGHLKADSRKRQLEREGNASTRQSTSSPLPEIDELLSEVAMPPSTIGSKYTQAHSGASVTSLTSRAGSCFPSSSRSSISSTSRQLRLRSKSLFSLSQRSSTAPTSSEANATTASISSANSASTTTNMFKAAKALSKRLSSTALRSAEPSTGIVKGQVSVIPEYDHTKPSPLSDKEPSLDKGSSFELNTDDDNPNRTLRRKKRLGGPPLPQPAPAPLNTSTLRKRVSATTLDAPQPISVSFKLGTRPASPESGKSTNRAIKFDLGSEANSTASPPAPALDKGKGVARSPSSDDPVRDTPVVHVSKPSVDDVHVEETQSAPSAPVSILKRPSPTSSISPPPSTIQTMQPLPSLPSPSSSPTSPRIGTLSRPYYSAIRKHTMSAPAPAYVYKPAPPSRPTSSSGHPPSAFALQPPVTPFMRRPLSLGAAPMSVPNMTSVLSGDTGDMSVFENDSDDDASSKSTQFGRKASSLSKAFGRKRRTWSSGADDPSVPPSSFSKPSGNTKRRNSHGASSPSSPSSRRSSQRPLPPLPLIRPGGVSMSGEIELRMSLAMIEQHERAQQIQKEQMEGNLEAAAEIEQMVPRYRFKARPEPGTVEREAAERLGMERERERQGGVFAKVRKFKGMVKGFLG